MSSNSSNSSKGKAGNTKQLSPAKNWCLTLNNYSDKEYNDLKEWCSSNSSYILGKEVGEEGTPHIQGYIRLHTKMRLTALKKVNNRIHFEKAKASMMDNYNYCKKDGDYVQTLIEDVYIESPPAIFCPLKKLMRDYDFPKGDRKINVIVDVVGGKGKTEFCRWACQEFKDCIITGGKAADMKNQIVEFKKINFRCPKYILIDIPRSNIGFLSYQGIEEIKNMLFYSGKYEGGMIIGNKPFVCLFMNEKPEVEKMSKDRWNIMYI